MITSAHSAHPTAALRDDDRLLVDCKEVVRVTGISRRQIYRMVASGTFPKQVVIPGTRSRPWRMADVVEWVEKLD